MVGAVTARRDRWHVLGAAAVLSPSEAVEALGGRAATAREWLQARGLIRDIPGLGRRGLPGVEGGQVFRLVAGGEVDDG